MHNAVHQCTVQAADKSTEQGGTVMISRGPGPTVQDGRLEDRLKDQELAS